MTRTTTNRVLAVFASVGLVVTAWFTMDATAGAQAPGNVSWTPQDAGSGDIITVSFTGCELGESVLVTTWRPAGAGANEVLTTSNGSATTSVTIALPTTLSPGEQYGVGVYCGGTKTTDPERHVLEFGFVPENGTPSDTTTTTTVPDQDTTTTVPDQDTTTTVPDQDTTTTVPDQDTTTTVPSDGTGPASVARPVTATPTYTG